MTDLQSKLGQIKLVILDVDGVLTDDTVWMGSQGMEMKRFCIADGLGIYLAQKHGIRVAFLSGRPSPATSLRAKELGVEDVHQQPTDKILFYNSLKDKYGLDDSVIAYMGNDLVDVDVLKQCGLSITVPDSPRTVTEASEYVTQKRGGHGAVREVLDMIMDAKGINEGNRLA